jgi:hypothetical protein
MDSARKLLQKKMNRNWNDPKLREIFYFKKNSSFTMDKYVWNYPPMHKAIMERKYTKVQILSITILLKFCTIKA